jgi:hypothetical protein
MAIELTTLPQIKRIAGTLHVRGYVPPAPMRDGNLPSARAQEGEVAGRHKDTEQKNHAGAR